MSVRMKIENNQSRIIKDTIGKILLYLASALSVMTLVVIIGFVFVKGLPGINIDFLTRQWQAKTTFINVELNNTEDTNLSDSYIASLGAHVEQNEDGYIAVTKLEKDSVLKDSKNLKGAAYEVKVDDVITKVLATDTNNITLEELNKQFNEAALNGETLKLKVTRPGGGIKPMVVSTLYIILLSLAIAAPIGILSALFLTEYAKKGKILVVIQFAIQMLAGIPSIIYGLFGMLVFVQMLKMQYSILAGALTLSILLLPTIISTTSEALKAIPKGYRESSLGLGATKLQTNFKIVLPNALPGILVAIILSIGRIVGESAALIWTAGTIAQIPSSLTGNTASAATLTTKLYQLLKEEGDVASACSIAVVIIVLIWVLNLLSKWITRRFTVKN
ncbi:MAG TPA: phosphate ABC transporter permease PtsA [Lachnospiraceae bacterium]|uniref:phosphate ABC transporter permease PstA n=1 Tax=Anaerosporobacter sp. TaxID=1872529 RepID=UPI000ECDB770|nr:phosphate ABC transporter permease PstA [Anaerosporobacter sp.]HAB59641.1 phosphate ABC transporter permease PtsA [Lachnospiraceae bacterium]